jgi:hypothetical protein
MVLVLLDKYDASDTWGRRKGPYDPLQDKVQFYHGVRPAYHSHCSGTKLFSENKNVLV